MNIKSTMTPLEESLWREQSIWRTGAKAGFDRDEYWWLVHEALGIEYFGKPLTQIAKEWAPWGITKATLYNHRFARVEGCPYCQEVKALT